MDGGPPEPAGSLAPTLGRMDATHLHMNHRRGRDEIRIPYEPNEHGLYLRADPSCKYHSVRWQHSIGRSKHGEFPVVVAAEHFKQLGYTAWAAEPELPDDSGYILISYPGKRRRLHPAYERMRSVFGAATVEKLNEVADAQKRMVTGSAGGGDPDLFVFRGPSRFFVEVKWRDQVTRKQEVAFPLIEQFCKVPVKIARIVPVTVRREFHAA